MSRQKIFIVILVLALLGGTGAILSRLKGLQKLGPPGVKTSLISGSQKLQVDLPESVSGYESKLVEMDPIVVKALPKDTSFGQRVYQSSDGFQTMVNVVLMGADRTSIHKPQICLTAQGWVIDQSDALTLPMTRPRAYDLPLMKLTATKQIVADGKTLTARGVYVYWFVDGEQLTASHWQRFWLMGENLLRTGELQRWAYITFFSVCAPGQEEATFVRMKTLIAATVPEFQLVPRASK
jgi:hypothetical protein